MEKTNPKVTTKILTIPIISYLYPSMSMKVKVIIALTSTKNVREEEESLNKVTEYLKESPLKNKPVKQEGFPYSLTKIGKVRTKTKKSSFNIR